MSPEEEVAWCENVWNWIRDGGTWGVPRSGLMFRKEAQRNTLVLYERMQHVPEFGITADELSEQQDGEVLAIRERFEKLGIAVVDETISR